MRPTPRWDKQRESTRRAGGAAEEVLLLLPRNKASAAERHVHDVARRHHGHHDEEQHAIAERGRNPANQEGAQPNSYVEQHEIGGIRGGETIIGAATHGEHEAIGLHRANAYASKRRRHKEHDAILREAHDEHARAQAGKAQGHDALIASRIEPSPREWTRHEHGDGI